MRTTTVALLKPDAIRRRLVGKILTRIEDSPLVIEQIRSVGLLHVPTAEVFYEEHKGRPYYDALIAFMTAGPMMALALSMDGPDAVVTWRNLMGVADPSKRDPLSIRGSLAAGMPTMENLVHGSDSSAAAKREWLVLTTRGVL